MIRAVFFDIDGTLLSHTRGDVPPDARAALSALAEKGIRVFVATGRHIQEIEALPVRDIPFDGYVLLNGQLCLDAGRKRIFCNPVDSADVRRMLPAFEGRETPAVFVEENRLYANFSNERIASVQRDISTGVPRIGTYGGEPIYQMTVFTDADTAHALLRRLAHCKMTQWHPYGFDILPDDGGKAAGMREILAHFAISEADVMAFGDGENDVDMLRLAGVGVAMGNAADAAKRSADYVTGDIDAGGVVQALVHYGVL